ncbi:ABC transporter ATP-binding protein [Bifidobacterium platyrrhinorum]|uniref:ATP-binding cassette domain-containing protein n=1 Tax=Bifidobacterium platyrrhinorum TaxID=2661628 RepID=A0A6L9SRJ1_9BIFI|nr:ABC transporter ATP-binding protein [Bifidobacterium platyrrhinorum]NEG55186.1 ATP-binding cassette domain-containing protein [Bifidobacterium platyrrhinorum]
MSAGNVVAATNLGIAYGGAGGFALDGIDFTLRPGEIHGIVGESGSGKSTLGLSLLGLLPDNARLSADTFDVAGHDMASASERDWLPVRRGVGSMVFQEPSTALDPTVPVGRQIEESLELAGWPREKRRPRALQILERVHLPEPERRAGMYPHQLSGGQRQRVCIAMALAPRPKFLIADEPTSALDVTVQSEILDLFREIREVTDIGIAFISHDLAVISQIADRVTVLYRGRLIQHGTVHEVLRDHPEPYTRALLDAVPSVHDAPKSKFDIHRTAYATPRGDAAPRTRTGDDDE